MMMWVFTSMGIAAFSVAALELMRETEPPDRRPQERHAFRWDTMTDSDLDALLEEFRGEGEGPGKAPERLAA